jgi:membrane-associated phospholipid phosphatase
MRMLSKPLLATLLVALFVAAALVGGAENGLERSVMLRIAELRADCPDLTGAAASLTRLGGAYVTLGVAGAAAVWLLLRSAPARALLLALTVLVERLLVDVSKDWIGRPRPNFELDWLPQSLAFPSGHAANSMTAFLATALIAAPPGLRRTAAIAAVAVSILVGLTRIYLGVHWPSDVLGGWVLGALAVGVGLAVGQRSGALHFEPQHQIVGRHRPSLDEDEAA